MANALEMELFARGKRTYILDGDNVRQGLNKDLGFTDADRIENIRRIAEVARLMLDAGLIVMTAFISPFRQDREMARELIGPENFLEIYISTPLGVCEQRDVKGLYRKARNGLLSNMTGLDSPYEAPERPDIELNCSGSCITESLQKILNIVLAQQPSQAISNSVTKLPSNRKRTANSNAFRGIHGATNSGLASIPCENL